MEPRSLPPPRGTIAACRIYFHWISWFSTCDFPVIFILSTDLIFCDFRGSTSPSYINRNRKSQCKIVDGQICGRAGAFGRRRRAASTAPPQQHKSVRLSQAQHKARSHNETAPVVRWTNRPRGDAPMEGRVKVVCNCACGNSFCLCLFHTLYGQSKLVRRRRERQPTQRQ